MSHYRAADPAIFYLPLVIADDAAYFIIVGFDVGVHHAASYGAPVATSDATHSRIFAIDGAGHGTVLYEAVVLAGDATHEVIVTTDVTDYIEVVNAAFGINRAE